jgi:phage shock protein C
MNTILSQRPGGPYRSRHGRVFGVCRGLADHFSLNVFWLRAFVLIAFLLTGFYPVFLVYLIVALLMKPEPIMPVSNLDEADFYRSYADTPELALDRLRRTFEHLDRRIQRLESVVTAADFDWDQRMNAQENRAR